MLSATLIVTNIKQLLTVPSDCKNVENKLGLIEDAALAIHNDKIIWIGKNEDCFNHVKLESNGIEISGQNKVVCPCFIDAHTHISGYPYGRANDFENRTYKDENYAGIAHKGGGIRTTIQRTQNASDEELEVLSLRILNEFLRHGVGTVEAKSGYGLHKDHELRQIKIIQNISAKHPITIVPTYLAHVLDTETSRENYVNSIVEDILPNVATKVKSVDVFCDKIAFNIEEAEKIIKQGISQGLFASVHVDQTSKYYAAEAMANIGATSLSHLENISSEGIAAMRNNNTIAILFPSCSIHLDAPLPPAKLLAQNNIRIALSTDWNPGSSPCTNILLVGYFAAKFLKMTLADIMRALTIHPASALLLDHKIGSLEVGKVGDLCIFDLNDWRDLFTQCGNTPQVSVIKSGVVVYK